MTLWEAATLRLTRFAEGCSVNRREREAPFIVRRSYERASIIVAVYKKGAAGPYRQRWKLLGTHDQSVDLQPPGP